MNRFMLTTAMLGLLAACLTPSLRADDRHKESHLTINQPLQIQDTLLAPGQYVFKLADPDVDHRVVSIYNADGTRLERIIMGLPAYRADAGDKTQFTIYQSQGNQPVTLKSWFYAGDNFGVEFPQKKLANENGRVVKSKGKGQTVNAADDASSARD